MIKRVSRIGVALCRSDALAIATLRVLVAAVCMILALTNKGQFQFNTEADDLVAAGYFLWSMFTIVAAIEYMDFDYISSGLILIADVMLFIAAPYIGLTSVSDAVIVSATLLILIVLAANIRWNFRTAVNVTVLLNALSLALFLITLRQLPAEDDLYARRIAFTLIPSLFVLWLCSRMSMWRKPAMGLQAVWLDQAALQEIGASSRKLLGCDRVSVTWMSDEQSLRYLEHDETTMANALQRAIDLEDEGDVERTVVFTMNFSKLPGSLVVKDGWSADWVLLSKDQRDLELDRDDEKCLVASVRGSTGWGVIIASGIPLISWSDLRFFYATAESIRARCDSLVATALVHESELFRLRNAIARDLHDSVAQSLAGAKFWIAGLIDAASTDQQRQELVRLRDAMDGETRNLRTIIDSLRDREGIAIHSLLEQILRETLDNLSAQWRIGVNLDAAIPAGSKVDATVAFGIQQILREAVANAVRHGKATSVAVRCTRDDYEVRLEITDNGTGFTTASEPRTLRERVVAFNGTLSIRSAPGNTTLYISLRSGAPT